MPVNKNNVKKVNLFIIKFLYSFRKLYFRQGKFLYAIALCDATASLISQEHHQNMQYAKNAYAMVHSNISITLLANERSNVLKPAYHFLELKKLMKWSFSELVWNHLVQINFATAKWWKFDHKPGVTKVRWKVASKNKIHSRWRAIALRDFLLLFWNLIG